MLTVRCPSCGESDDIVGHDTDHGKVVECLACGHRWQRDLTPTCRLCGSTKLEAISTATLEEAGRGEQRTPSGIRDIHQCLACGARDATSSSPTPAGPDWQQPSVRAAARRSASEPDAHRGLSPDQRRVNSAFGTFGVGEVVGGRWSLTALLRWSSTASLWHAHDGDRRVVFRLVHPRLVRSADRATLHARSAQAAARVEHPNLLRLLDVRIRHSDVLMVAEAVTGPTAAERPPLERHQFLTVAAGASQALAALHEQGVVHLGLRPDRLLLPDGDRPRLVDFGSDRVRAANPDVPSSVDPLAWRAPEQIVGGAQTPAADVYTLAFTLWVVAGGDLERLGPSPVARAQERIAGDLPRLESPILPPSVSDAIAVATRRDPADRPEAADLAALLGSP